MVVFSALISIPACVTHSFKVSEYTNLSFANSFIISPSTGIENTGSEVFISSLISVFEVTISLFS